jgi:Ca2+-binding RTX toxin-like protein
VKYFALNLSRPDRPLPRRRRALRVLDLLEDRTNPVVVTGTAGADTIAVELVYADGALEPHAADVMVNSVVAATIDLDGSWPHPTTTWFLAEPLEIDGLGGNDHISVGLVRPMSDMSGNLIVRGGIGDDTLVGGNGHDYLYGDAGADDLSAGIDEDSLFADMDDVRLVGGGGIDLLVMDVSGTVAVTPTSMTINGRTLSEAAGTFVNIGAVELFGSEGPDVLSSTGLFWAELWGNGGDDRLDIDASSHSLASGGDGNDTVNGAAGPDSLYGGAGNDRLSGGADASPDWTHNLLDGGIGNDVLIGGTGTNTLLGDEGNDHLTGGPLGDELYGEEGRDTLLGIDGPDTLYGDGGWDSDPLESIAADALDGGAGDDTIYADTADTRLAGGAGLDSLTALGIRRSVVLTNSTITFNGRQVPSSGFESATLTGSDTADNLDAGRFSGTAYLSGLEGNDVLRTGAGGGWLDGGPGADALSGGAGDDSLTADASDTRMAGGGGLNDLSVTGIQGTAVLHNTALFLNGRRITTGGLAFVSLSGSDLADRLDASRFSGGTNLTAFAGDDVLRAGAGDSSLDGGPGADALDGGAGDDQFTADGADTRLVGAGGSNTLYLSDVAGTAILTDTSLTINGRVVPFGGMAAVSLSGSDGVDILDAAGFSGPTTVSGGGGSDQLMASQGGAGVYGGTGDDSITGGPGNDFLYGDAGADGFAAGGGDDFLTADADDTWLDGGSGVNRASISGIAGTADLDDTSLTINGRPITATGLNFVTLSGSDGHDTLRAFGFNGFLSLYGGAGDDILVAGNVASTLNGGLGNDSISGSDGNDLLQGDWGDDMLFGGDGDDNLDGWYGNDVLQAGAGDDNLYGGPGADSLYGEAGSDYLDGGDWDNDVLLGGADADQFKLDFFPAFRDWEQLNDDFNAAEGDTQV